MKSRPRVLHFVTGGGSGATNVALDLACGHLATGNFEPLLVFRRKRAPLPDAMAARVAANGLAVAWVDEGPKWTTRAQLRALIARFRPQVVAAHGFSEHIWGRQVAQACNVPAIVHIEQNCERYSFWRRWQARRLNAGTSATVCVSTGVAEHVRRLDLAGPRIEIIHNAVDVARYAAGAGPFAARGNDVVMAARFARQKDHATLVRATRRLVDSGWAGRLLLLGGGKSSHRSRCEALVRRLGLGDRVDFLGRVDRPEIHFQKCRAAVLSTHYEGLPLVLLESMAAGCAAIASNAPGVPDVIQPGQNGWLFPPGDDATLAVILASVLAGGPEVEAVVARGRADAPARFSLGEMIARYEALFAELLPSFNPPS